MNDDDKVGYGRPPKVYRFKKGQSGNPLGSSQKARKRQRRQVLSFDDVVLDDARKPIRIREGNRTSTISLREALLQKLYAMGLNGNRLALKVSLDKITEAEQNQREQILDLYEAALDYKENYPARAKYCRDRGLAPLLPHPEDVQLDPYTGKVTITGPRNHEDFATLKKLLQARKFLMTELEGQRSDIDECARDGYVPPPSELEIVSLLESYLNDCDSELLRQGWLPRVARDKKP
jgi:hypothetical protein